MSYVALGELISKAKVEKCGSRSFPVLSMTMHDGIVFQNDRFKKDIASIDRSNYSVVNRNQLVVSFPIDEGVLAVQDITDAGIVSPAYKIWDIDQSMVVPKYLETWLRSPRSIEYYKSKLRGTTARRRSIPENDFLTMPVLVPSYKVQLHAVDLINRVRHLIQKREQQLSALDNLIKARFVEMFGDFKTNSKGWPMVGFDEIAIIDGNMTTDYEKYADYPHIGIDSIEKETGLLKGYRTVAEDGVISGKYVFTPAHIIYSKIRPNLNKVALPGFEGLCSADAYPILPIEEKCNRVFLAYNMRSAYFLDYILQFCNRTNLPKVNRKEVAGFKTPLPPIDIQNEFAAFVAQIDKSKYVILWIVLVLQLRQTQSLSFDSNIHNRRII